MKVVDSGVVVQLLCRGLDARVVASDQLAAPHLIDSEVMDAFRGMHAGGQITAAEAQAAISGFDRLIIDRYAAVALRPRMWQLRNNLSAYNATYVALAEALHAALITTDARIATAAGVRCAVEVV